jgi:hypothetical protein
MRSSVRFVDSSVKEEYSKSVIKKWLDKAIQKLENDAFSGIQIQKRLFPKQYSDFDNLWKINLPRGWRLIYTLYRYEEGLVSVIIFWMDHKDYEKRFKY